jgi:Calcineurin-like phosphoesterase
MPPKQNLVDDYAAQANSINAADYLMLIKKTVLQLRLEQKDKKTRRDSGRFLCLPHSGTAIIVGDLHGDLASLTYILKNSHFVKDAQQGKNLRLIFLGDYGDRGLYSPEVYFVILKLKETFPDKVVLMRGNHEGPDDLIPCPYDLPERFRAKFGEEEGETLVFELRKLFKRLYNAVLIEKWAILIHGGVPSNAKSIEDLAWAHKTHPQNSTLEEMLWSDPQDCLDGTSPSPRGAGKLFGPNVTNKQLELLGVNVLIRGHEVCQDGFRFNHDGKALTLFSTNKGKYWNKYGAYLKINLRNKINNPQRIQKSIIQFE